MNWNYPLKWNIHLVYKGKRWLCKCKAMKYQISQLYGETPLKLYCISILWERFNSQWILADSPRTGCGGKIPSASQSFILTPHCLTEAPFRAVKFLHILLSTQNKNAYSLLPALQKVSEMTLNTINCLVAEWQSQLKCLFPSVPAHDCSFLAPQSSFSQLCQHSYSRRYSANWDSELTQG